MNVNWGDQDESGWHVVRPAASPPPRPPWWRRTDWFSLAMIALAVLFVFAVALWMSFHSSP